MAKHWMRQITPELLDRCGPAGGAAPSLPYGVNWMQQPASASDFAASRPLPSASRSEPMFVGMGGRVDADLGTVPIVGAVRTPGR
jgi:hypothetical protein